MKTTAINNGSVTNKANGTVSGGNVSGSMSDIKTNGSTVNGKTDAGKESDKINGLPVSKEFADAKKTDHKPDVKPAQQNPQEQTPKTEYTEDKEEAKPHAKHALNLEETLLLVAELGKKTALRDKYNGYIDTLKDFVIAQNDDDMASGSANFKSCELVIRDGQGHEFRTDSATVIAGTVNFMSGRFSERLAEVEAEIVIPD